MTIDTLAITDRAYEAQCALNGIKSFAYGGVVSETMARANLSALRQQIEQMEALFNGSDEEPLPR